MKCQLGASYIKGDEKDKSTRAKGAFFREYVCVSSVYILIKFLSNNFVTYRMPIRTHVSLAKHTLSYSNTGVFHAIGRKYLFFLISRELVCTLIFFLLGKCICV